MVRSKALIVSLPLEGTSEGSESVLTVIFYSPMSQVLDGFEPKPSSPEEKPSHLAS
jgi:hypothetical protein